MKAKLFLTCEHGGQNIPRELSSKVSPKSEWSDSHRAYDIGALDMAKYLSRRLQLELVSNSITRLLIDFNRTPDHIQFWGPYAKQLTDKHRLHLRSLYQAYLTKVEETLGGEILMKNRVHFSVHSFTPVMKQKLRSTEIGLLFDPKRELELKIAKALRDILTHDYRVHFNRPYRGTSNGLTSYLRSQYTKHYAGIEVEFNQALLLGPELSHLKQKVGSAMQQVFG